MSRLSKRVTIACCLAIATVVWEVDGQECKAGETECSSSNNSGYGTPPSPPFPFDVGPEALEELWQGKQIDRIPLNKLTKAYFLHRYVEGQRPLVIEGALLDSPMYTNWNWTRLAKEYQNTIVSTKYKPSDPSENCGWANLCEGPNMNMGDAIRSIAYGERSKEEQDVGALLYLLDLQLSDDFPEVYKDYRTPSWISDNLQGAGGRSEHFPSAFTGAKGTTTGIHIDGYGTSFSLSLYDGVKQLIFFPLEHGRFLCTKDNEHPLSSPKYGVDPFNPDFKACPTARDATAYFTTMKGGDLLYSPANIIHGARNLEPSFSASHNYLTKHDLHPFIDYGRDRYWNQPIHEGAARDAYMHMDLLFMMNEFSFEGMDAGTHGNDEFLSEQTVPDFRAKSETNLREFMLHVFHNMDTYGYQSRPYRLAWLNDAVTVRPMLEKAEVFECLTDEQKEKIENDFRATFTELHCSDDDFDAYKSLTCEFHTAELCRRLIEEANTIQEKLLGPEGKEWGMPKSPDWNVYGKGEVE